MSLTPYQVEILLHHYTCPSEFPRSDAPMYLSTVEDFILKGVLVNDSEYYTTTDLGKAWIKEILSVPLPEVQYVGRNGVIEDIGLRLE